MTHVTRRTRTRWELDFIKKHIYSLALLLFVKLQVLGLRLVNFIFTLDNNHNDNHNNDNDNNPLPNFFKGTVLGVKEQGLGIRDKR